MDLAGTAGVLGAGVPGKAQEGQTRMSDRVQTLHYRGSAGLVVDVDRLIASRLLAQANSGGGKSRAIRQLLEETHGKVQHFVLDPEGEFATLRERFDYVLAAGKGGDVVASPKHAKVLCRRLMELGASAVIDLYDLALADRREFVRVFLEELMSLPRDLWRPLLVVIDEAHVFAPERGSGDATSTDAVIALCTQGRKRGYCAVLATQRISKLHKDAAAELLNKLIGRTGLDVDVKRAGDELGFDKEERAGLKHLAPGEFFAYGPAIATEVRRVRTGDVVTTHPEIGSAGAVAPPAPSKVKAMLAQLADLPKEAAEEARTIAELQQGVRRLEGELRQARKASPAPDPAVTQRAIEAAVGKAVADERQRQDRLRRVLRSQIAGVVTGLRGGIRAAVDGVAQQLGGAADRLASVVENIDQDWMPASAEALPPARHASRVAAAVPGGVPAAPARSPIMDRPADRAASTEGVSTPQRKMLNALATMREVTRGDRWTACRAMSSPHSATNRPRVRAGIRISARSGRRD
jgi:hypothetical protein